MRDPRYMCAKYEHCTLHRLTVTFKVQAGGQTYKLTNRQTDLNDMTPDYRSRGNTKLHILTQNVKTNNNLFTCSVTMSEKIATTSLSAFNIEKLSRLKELNNLKEL